MTPPPPCLPSGRSPDVEFVVPVYNEERELARNVARLRTFLAATFPWTFQITIADNASTDATWPIAQGLAAQHGDVRAVRLAHKGRGGALHAVWSGSDATVVAYLDVDLSTGLPALLPLVAPLMSGHSDVSVGTRLSTGARVVRGPRREVISRGYNTLLHAVLRTGFSDAPCGFKALRAEAAQALLPLVADTEWFFDTELLTLAERAGLRIHEVPVDWIDDADSRVDLARTALADLRGIARLTAGLTAGRIPIADVRARFRRRPLQPPSAGLPAQLVRFAAVGLLSTAAFLLLYLLLRATMPAQAANAVALLVTAIGNTAANRRYTFEVPDSAGVLWHHLQGLALFAAALALAAAALAGLHAVEPRPSRGLEVTALVIANLVATGMRFVALRWVFRGRAPDRAGLATLISTSPETSTTTETSPSTPIELSTPSELLTELCTDPALALPPARITRSA